MKKLLLFISMNNYIRNKNPRHRERVASHPHIYIHIYIRTVSAVMSRRKGVHSRRYLEADSYLSHGI